MQYSLFCISYICSISTRPADVFKLPPLPQPWQSGRCVDVEAMVSGEGDTTATINYPQCKSDVLSSLRHALPSTTLALWQIVKFSLFKDLQYFIIIYKAKRFSKFVSKVLWSEAEGSRVSRQLVFYVWEQFYLVFLFYVDVPQGADGFLLSPVSGHPVPSRCTRGG